MWVLTKLSGHMCKKFEVKIKGGCQSKKTAEMLSYSKMPLVGWEEIHTLRLYLLQKIFNEYWEITCLFFNIYGKLCLHGGKFEKKKKNGQGACSTIKDICNTHQERFILRFYLQGPQ